MYCEHFGLKLPPFNNTPDPRFFFNTPDHEEALASLVYAVEQRKGFVLVTGEVGAGKTLLSRLLLNRIGSGVRTAVITNTRLTGPELLLSICREFEINTNDATTAAELTHRLEEYLLDLYARDRLAVVIIDEAQNLPVEALEELRMLGNLEADDAKLLQVILLGQPELQEAFRHPSLRQTYQRIFRTYHLNALDHALTCGYVEHRLRVAGLPASRRIFARDAVDAVFRHSEGIPRLINQICDNALLSAFGGGRELVTSALIDEVVEQMLSLKVRGPKAPQGELAKRMVGNDRAETPAVEPSGVSFSTEWARIDARLQSFESALADVRRGAAVAPEPGRKDSGFVQSLADRLATLESGISEVRRHQEAIATHRDRTTAELKDIRRFRDETVSMVDAALLGVRESEDRIRSFLDTAEARAQSIEHRAAAAMQAANDAQQGIERRTRELVTEFDSISSDHKQRVDEALTESRSETDAIRSLRKEIATFQQHVIESHRESESRVAKAIAEASELSTSLESRAREFLTASKVQTGDLQEQLKKLIDDMREKSAASQARMVELVSQQRNELEAAQVSLDECVRSAYARSNIVERESKRIIDDLKSQAKDVVDTVHGVRDRTVARAEEAAEKADALVTDMTSRMTTAHERMETLVTDAESRVNTACATFQDLQQKMASESNAACELAAAANNQTMRLLAQARESAESLLGKLRADVAEQTRLAEQVWQSNVDRGAKAIGEISQRLDAARAAAEESRKQLEGVISQTEAQIESARSSLESSLDQHRAQVANLSRDGLALRTDFERQVEQARASLDVLLRKHKEDVGARIGEMADETNAALRDAESAAENRVEALDKRLREASTNADRIYQDLKDAVEAIEQHAAACQASFDETSGALKQELDVLIGRQRKIVTDGKTEIEKLTQTVDATTGRFQHEMRQLNEAARSRIAAIGKELADVLAKAMARADDVRKGAEESTVTLAERVEKTRAEAAKSVESAEETMRRVRMQSKTSLEEVRQCLAQMNERADVIRRELGNVGDEIRHASKETVEQLSKTGDRVTSQIESLREAAMSDADANFKRLNVIRQQVEQSAEQMRQNAAKLLDQVQSGASALRRHADDMLTQAQSGAEKLNESAANMMLQAQTSSERFREQAESLLHNAESMSQGIRDEVQSLRSQLSEETDRIRRQVGEARHEIVQSRQETAKIVNEAAEAQHRAESRAGDLIKRAENVQTQAESLLAMPRELIDEAKRQAVALSEMSKKVSTVVRQLSDAGASAERNRGELVRAETDAEEKIRQLKAHTERVGQLLGIIRQLYGTMDARVERLRGRLSQFDELFRTVPRELEGLRSVLDTEMMRDRGGPPAHRAPAMNLTPPRETEHHGRTTSPGQPTAQPPSRGERLAPAESARFERARRDLPDLLHDDSPGGVATAPVGAATVSHAPVRSPQAPATKPEAPTNGGAAAQSRKIVREQLQAGSLGEIVQRNEKLQQWLKDMLGEDALNGGKP